MNLSNGCLFLRSFPTGLLLLGTLVPFSAVARPLVAQGENETNHSALVGLKAIVVQVGVFGDVDASGLTRDQLQAAAELELRRSDVPAYPITDTLALRRSPHNPGVLAVLIKLSCDEHI